MSDNFQQWWDREGSGIRPTADEDTEEFARRISSTGWNKASEIFLGRIAIIKDERMVELEWRVEWLLNEFAKDLHEYENWNSVEEWKQEILDHMNALQPEQGGES